MPFYIAYGLGLNANQSIPGLIALSKLSSSYVSLQVLLNERPRWVGEALELSLHTIYYSSCISNEQGVPTLQVWQVNQGEHFYFRYDDGTEFILDRQGTEVWATWPDNLTLEDTATYLLGPILGFVLRLRGVTCLHASAVVIQNQAVVFVGEAGAGKSTTAAAFAQRSYPVSSDDVVALVDHGDAFLVQPAYPRIRLWNSSVEALYGAPDALPRLVPTHPTWDKRYLDLTQPGYQFQSEPLPLGAIYLLGNRSDRPEAPWLEPVANQEQLLTLITNTYTNYLLNKSQRAQEFEVLSRLVKHIPIRRIIPHQDSTRLDKLLDTVLKDFAPSPIGP